LISNYHGYKVHPERARCLRYAVFGVRPNQQESIV
jgi:hypothetical protein